MEDVIFAQRIACARRLSVPATTPVSNLLRGLGHVFAVRIADAVALLLGAVFDNGAKHRPATERVTKAFGN
jgi:hypothetical protein